MSYTIEKLPGEPAILVTLNEDYDATTENAPSNQDIRNALDAHDGPMRLIVHFRANLSLDAVINGTNAARTAWHDPRLSRIILVTNNTALRFAAWGLKATTFGNLLVFATVDEALAFTRQQKNPVNA